MCLIHRQPAGGPSYREAKGGAFDFFHHKRDVRAITDIQPPVGDNGVDLLQARGVSVTKTPLEAAAAPLVGAL